MRGNGKIIQELESVFRGAGWNVIKVIWAREWDELLARDVDGVLVQQMNDTLDGESQKYSVDGGAYIREHFFGPDPRLRKLVEHLSDDDLAKLRRGGHDYRKVYAAYQAATEHTGAPTVDPRQDGQGLDARPGRRGAQHHPPGQEADRGRAASLPRPAGAADPGRRSSRTRRTTTPAPTPEEIEYLLERRRALGGPLPRASSARSRCRRPAPEVDASSPAGSQTRSRRRWPSPAPAQPDARQGLGPRIVPIIPDEARTFGMDPLFKEVGIYAALGQRYEPVDSNLVLSYREANDGQVLEEGITEAGSMASFQAAGTSYATHGEPMIPFYIFYSMFGFQRTGDQIWAFGDARGRGFLLGATAGRTTLNGEGLQHEDGHTHVLASTVPNVRAYDPAFAYEIAAIIRDGIARMYGKGEDVFYYLTLYNENYVAAADARGRRREGIVRGLYRFADGARRRQGRAGRRGSSARARSCSRRSRPATCSPSSSASRPRSAARRRSSCCATRRSRSSAGTGSIRTRGRRASRTSARSCRTRAARSSPRPTGSRRCPT